MRKIIKKIVGMCMIMGAILLLPICRMEAQNNSQTKFVSIAMIQISLRQTNEITGGKFRIIIDG